MCTSQRLTKIIEVELVLWSERKPSPKGSGFQCLALSFCDQFRASRELGGRAHYWRQNQGYNKALHSALVLLPGR